LDEEDELVVAVIDGPCTLLNKDVILPLPETHLVSAIVARGNAVKFQWSSIKPLVNYLESFLDSKSFLMVLRAH